jgi:hypothetical protein
MALVPDKKQQKISFYQSKIDPWTTNATAIGTTTTAVTALGTLVTAAQTAMDAQTTAEAAFRTAVEAANNAVNAMAAAGADIISAIRTKARTGGDGVYTLAQIPAPATPSPVGAPGQPKNFTVALNADGSLMLKWKCSNPAGSTGTIYQVWRRAGATGEFTYIGGAGAKQFLDAELPTGVSQVTYQIQAVRSTAVGPWAQFNVNFGTTSSGTMTAAVAEATPMRAAA